MKKVLITGGAGGIGSEIVKNFISHGYFAYIVDTDKETSAKLLEEFGPDKCQAIDLDVTDTAAISRYVSSLDKDFSLDHIITLAGRALEGEWQPFADQTLQLVRDSVSLNLLGHINIIHSFLPFLKNTPTDKSIIMISSINALTNFNLPAYSAAKAGLLGFMSGIVREFGEMGIRINVISPGTVITAATLAEPKDYEKLLKTTVIRKFATAKEVAKMAFAICNDFSTVTGQNFIIDAGQSQNHQQ